MKLFNIHIVFILTFPWFDRVLFAILSNSIAQRFNLKQSNSTVPIVHVQFIKIVTWFRGLLIISTLGFVFFVLMPPLGVLRQWNPQSLGVISYIELGLLLSENFFKGVADQKGVYYFSEECESGLDTHGGNSGGNCCVFPFKFRGKLYHDCTTDGYTIKWCSTTYDFKRDKKWGLCY